MQSDSLSICICFINVLNTHLRVPFNVDCTIQHCSVLFFFDRCFSPEFAVTWGLCPFPSPPSFSSLSYMSFLFFLFSHTVDCWFIKVSFSHRMIFAIKLQMCFLSVDKLICIIFQRHHASVGLLLSFSTVSQCID